MCSAANADRFELCLHELVLPEQTNHYGTLFAPNGLALLGKAAFLVAARFTRQPMVMAAASGIEFRQPVPVGALLQLQARITRTGRSSLTASVHASLDGAPNVLHGSFEMVAVDADGRPVPIAQPCMPAATPTHI
jgi:acyl-CoA thioesterase YciA